MRRLFERQFQNRPRVNPVRQQINMRPRVRFVQPPVPVPPQFPPPAVEIAENHPREGDQDSVHSAVNQVQEDQPVLNHEEQIRMAQEVILEFQRQQEQQEMLNNM